MAKKNTAAPLQPDDEDRDRDEKDKGDDQADAREPEGDGQADLTFDPAALEADAPPAPPNPTADPFDPAHLALSQDFAGQADVARKWDVIKVEKPTKSRVFRVHPDPCFRLRTVLLTLKEDNETYLVLPQLRQALASESLCGVHTLFACVSKAGAPFLWAVKMADTDGKWNVWHKSAYEIAENAQTRWARMQANRDAGYYVAEYDQRPPDLQQQPSWPDLQFRDWLELAFKGFTIDSLGHPVLRRLRLED